MNRNYLIARHGRLERVEEKRMTAMKFLGNCLLAAFLWAVIVWAVAGFWG